MNAATLSSGTHVTIKTSVQFKHNITAELRGPTRKITVCSSKVTISNLGFEVMEYVAKSVNNAVIYLFY